MSLDSWKAEFYPVEADQVPKKQAIAHALQKWIGLRKENLNRHGLQVFCSTIWEKTEGVFYQDAPVMAINADSCSLCHFYLKKQCEKCPLFATTGHRECEGDLDNGVYSPYEHWQSFHNPERMITALQQALANQSKKNDSKSK